MDLDLTKGHRTFRDKVRHFSEEEVLPVAREIDEKDLFPDDVITKAGKMGLLGIITPKEYGGMGKDLISYVLAIEEISKASPSVALTISVNNSLICSPLVHFGSEEQKTEYLPKLASGEWLGSFALTEPGAGTDAGSLSTTANRENDSYIINGSKMFITNMGKSSMILVFAKTSPEKGTRGISAFLVRAPDNALVTEAVLEGMGMRGSQQMSFQMKNLRVPIQNMLGKEGEGFKIGLWSLNMGRLGIAAQALGIAQAALEDALEYASKREQFGRPLSDFQAIQFRLADMAIEIEAAKSMIIRAAWRMEKGSASPSDPAMAKLLASHVAIKVSGDALTILGGRGYLKGSRVEKLYRDAKITEIYEGTSDVQRMIIARQLLSR
ncbi:MAG: acyl-CoA dehydrogenase [Methanomassiliicoccales archaeon]|nr:acyl-CoA dehydrogenase [Methanomassiliicoccales archaeon]NYT15114.1 acyl-CoA dehydrogenase [Methanomassiliicoccales archaeon]